MWTDERHKLFKEELVKGKRLNFQEIQKLNDAFK